MEIKCRIIKPLNKLVRRGEEDSSFCCMLTQYILFRLSSSVCFQYIFLWTSYYYFFNSGVLIAPPPPFAIGRLFVRLSYCKTHNVVVFFYLQLNLCFVFALMQWWLGEIFSLCLWLLVLVWLFVHNVMYVESADLSCSVMFTLFLFSVCLLPYPCLLLWCCRAWDLWETKILSLNDWGR